MSVDLKMKSAILVLLAFAAVVACAEKVLVVEAPSSEPEQASQPISAYGYLTKYAIPEAERRRKAEEELASNPERIVGGLPAGVGQYPWQAGLLISFQGEEGRGICGGSLISPTRVVTAAHCWFDGLNQASMYEVVLGSTRLFSGGTRVLTSAVVTHPRWFPWLVRHDVAVAYLPSPVASTASSAMIAPISLPRGSELSENFAGSKAIASGFGLTADNGGITTDQFLSHVSLDIISNSVCRLAFPLNLHETNICTRGLSGGTCQGDSGGPLVVMRDRPVLVGITSFGSALGCESILPAVYARVTAYMDFINEHL